MKHIISGTNRRGSRSLQIANYVQTLYQQQGEATEIIDLAELPYQELTGIHYGGAQPLHSTWNEAVKKVTGSEGLIMVVPEYNGSFPGALKYFIDHWHYPTSFEYRPVCFIGLGRGAFGGLRPIEQLQQIFGYRNAYQFPMRVFLASINKIWQDGHLTDAFASQLLKDQAAGFSKFVKALEGQGLDANSVNARRPAPVKK